MARCTALPANEKVRRGGSERRVEVVPCSLLLLLSRCSVPGGGVVVAAGAAAGAAVGAAATARSQDPSTVTPWPRDDPAEMFALVAVPCSGATGVAVPTKRKKKKKERKKEGKYEEDEDEDEDEDEEEDEEKVDKEDERMEKG
uniref:Uncharacterized protein n=1 Tax=Vespula pensylvanica TaxID=30213 RepID=A0A834NWH5_VESPE|nr:hypothetical protein H0235_010127 [Vespula pensylvanica]